MFFFTIAGLEALLIRIQLAVPDNQFLSENIYNQAFTMHGVTMIFLVVIPLGAAFANYLIPLQIGARDVAFPRLNAFSFWCFLAGGLFLNTAWFLGGAPDGGWFAYAPNTSVTFAPGAGMDFYALGLQITGIASLVGAINLIVTVLNMRAPGMTLLKMPVFTWMSLVVQFLLLFAMPVIAVALFLLTFDRRFGANFFNVEAGGSPLLWQHLFWIFGHPEVYIMILPAFGIISETIPTFSRKPIFGYPFMVGSGIAIGFMGWGVWAHHMFASGLGPISVAAFSLSTMFIAVPTGVKILNWLATMWGGRLRFTTSMMFSIAVVCMFTIGGLSGVTHAVAPSDTQQTDTYYIVAHFHYVIFGGALLGFFAGLYFWWPKMFGVRLGETWGKVNFWLMFIGFNLTFGPMHILGLQGMARRHHSYAAEDGFAFWNALVSAGSAVIGLSMIAFLINIYVSHRAQKRNPVDVGPDPWDARGLEWSTASPTPAHNFDVDPVVDFQDDWIVRKAYPEDIAQDGSATDVHLPSPSYWPLVLALSLPIVGYALIFTLWLLIPGLILLVGGFVGWALEPADDPEARHDAGAHDAPIGGGVDELSAANGLQS
ncbi:UNVERIFIED_CONTAM: hypothetical protein GTU68_063320 [Idotea baltica]|nr:hypothetical protein [Idotea baltica]